MCIETRLCDKNDIIHQETTYKNIYNTQITKVKINYEHHNMNGKYEIFPINYFKIV